MEGAAAGTVPDDAPPQTSSSSEPPRRRCDLAANIDGQQMARVPLVLSFDFPVLLAFVFFCAMWLECFLFACGSHVLACSWSLEAGK
eukprot:429289-Rhodomonas_salina.1